MFSYELLELILQTTHQLGLSNIEHILERSLLPTWWPVREPKRMGA